MGPSVASTIVARDDSLAARLALGALLLLTTVATSMAVARTWGGQYWWPGSITAGSLTGLALIRHRIPWLAVALGQGIALVAVGLSATLDFPAELSPAAALALVVLTAAGVRRLSPPRAIWVAFGSLFVATASLFASGISSGGVPLVAAMNAIGWVVAVASGLVLRSLDERSAAVAMSVRREVQLELARELHDVVAHHITGIVLQAQAGQLVARTDPVTAEETLHQIEQAGSASLAAIRRVLGLLRGDPESDLLSCDADGIRRLAQRVLGPDGPQVCLELAPRREPWPAPAEAVAYRTIQEALTNAARHALGATCIKVAVEQAQGFLHVRVDDNGTASPQPDPTRRGYGLVGMTERIQGVGGSVTAGPQLKGGGWRVHAKIPVLQEDQP